MLKIQVLISDEILGSASYFFESDLTRQLLSGPARVLLEEGVIRLHIDEDLDDFTDHAFNKQTKSPAGMSAYADSRALERRARDLDAMAKPYRRQSVDISGLIVELWFDDLTPRNPTRGTLASVCARLGAEGPPGAEYWAGALALIASERSGDFVWDYVAPRLHQLECPPWAQRRIRIRLADMYARAAASTIYAAPDVLSLGFDALSPLTVDSYHDPELLLAVFRRMGIVDLIGKLGFDQVLTLKRSPEWIAFRSVYASILRNVSDDPSIVAELLVMIGRVESAHSVFPSDGYSQEVPRNAFLDALDSVLRASSPRGENGADGSNGRRDALAVIYNVLSSLSESLSAGPVTMFTRRLGMPDSHGAAATGEIVVGVVTIIGEENRAVREWLDGLGAQKFRDRGRVYRRAVLQTQSGPVTILTTQAANMGESSALMAAQALHTLSDCVMLVLLGIAGGLSPEVHCGDVVIANQIINYGPVALSSDGPQHRGVSSSVPFEIQTALNDWFSERGEPVSLDSGPSSSELGRAQFSLQRGPIGTGPAVVKYRDDPVRQWLLTFNQKTMAVETEAQAMATYFYEAGAASDVGFSYLVMRGISDHADEEKNDVWKLAASENAVQALRGILDVLLTGIA